MAYPSALIVSCGYPSFLARESHAISMAVDEVLFGIRRWMISQYGSTIVLCEKPTSFA